MTKGLSFLAAAGLVLAGVGAAYARQEKFDICHQGNTIAVAAPALADHFDHGDVLCSCEVVDDCAAQGGTLDDYCDCAVGQSQPCDPAGTCDTEFTFCGGSENCVCGTATDGSGSCVGTETPCVDLVPCPNGDSDCPTGSVCIVDSCCEGPVCGLVCPTP